METEKRIEHNLEMLGWFQRQGLEPELCAGDAFSLTANLDQDAICQLLRRDDIRVSIRLGKGCVALHAKNEESISTLEGKNALAANVLKSLSLTENYYLYKLAPEQWGNKQDSEEYESPDGAVELAFIGEYGRIPAPFIIYEGHEKPDYVFGFDGYEPRSFSLWHDKFWKQFCDLAFNHFGSPLPLQESNTLLPVCSDEMIPESVRAYVVHKAEQFAALREGILTSLVAALGTLIGGKLSVFPLSKNRSWQEHVVVRVVLAFLSGSAKTDSMLAGLSFLLSLEDEELNKWESDQKDKSKEIKKLEKQKKNRESEWEAAQSNLRRLAARQKVFERDGNTEKLADIRFQIEEETELATALEGEISGISKAFEKLVEAKPPRFTTTDITREKAEILMAENPNGALIWNDEISGLFWGMEGPSGERYRNLLQTSSKGTVSAKTDRVGRGLTSVAGQRLHVFGLIQPDKLAFYLNFLRNRGKLNDGTIQRFMIFVSEQMPEYDLDKVDCESDDALTDEMERIFALLKEFDPHVLGRNLVDYQGKLFIHFEPDAQAVFKEWLQEKTSLVSRLTSVNRPLSSYLKKLPHHVCVFALIFHVLDWAKLAINGKNIGDHSQISLSALQRALAWAELSQVHAESIYQQSSDTAFVMARAILEKIVTGAIENEMTVRDVMKKQWVGFERAEDIKAGFALLAARNIARVVGVKSGDGPGKPRQVIQVNRVISDRAVANKSVSEKMEQLEIEAVAPPLFQTKWLTQVPVGYAASVKVPEVAEEDTFASEYADDVSDSSSPEQCVLLDTENDGNDADLLKEGEVDKASGEVLRFVKSRSLESLPGGGSSVAVA